MEHTDPNPDRLALSSSATSLSIDMARRCAQPLAAIPSHGALPEGVCVDPTGVTILDCAAPSMVSPRPYDKEDGRGVVGARTTNVLFADRVLDDLIDLAARSMGLSVPDVTGRCRRTKHTDARKLVCVLARRIASCGRGTDPTPITYERIGNALGGRDHSTVLYLEKAGLILLHSTTRLPRVKTLQDQMAWMLRHLRRLGYAAAGTEGWNVDHMPALIDPTFDDRVAGLLGRLETDVQPAADEDGEGVCTD